MKSSSIGTANKRVVNKDINDRDDSEISNREFSGDNSNDDTVVIVAFPRMTWDKVNEIANALECTSSEVLALALRELDKTIEKNDLKIKKEGLK